MPRARTSQEVFVDSLPPGRVVFTPSFHKVVCQSNIVGVVLALLEREDIKSSVSQKAKASEFSPLEIAKNVGNEDGVELPTFA